MSWSAFTLGAFSRPLSSDASKKGWGRAARSPPATKRTGRRRIPVGSYPMNRYAPSYFQGVPPPPPGSEASDDKSCDYVYSPPTGQLTANQFLNPDTLEIQVDADFRLRAFYLALFTGPFQMQLID